jgi:hypothetical protein
LIAIVRVVRVLGPGPTFVAIASRICIRRSLRSARAPRRFNLTERRRFAPAASVNVACPTTIRLVRLASDAGTSEEATTVTEQREPPAGQPASSPVPSVKLEPCALIDGPPECVTLAVGVVVVAVVVVVDVSLVLPGCSDAPPPGVEPPEF